jgi:murein DD-endopeptidase MepM/ murein hydrolase activator NlpD
MPTTYKRIDATVPVLPDPKGLAFVVKKDFSPQHRGVDLQLAAGAPCIAPESGVVWVAANRNDVPGFEGMGPAFVYLRGDSGMFHLLAELGAVPRTAGHVEHGASEGDGYLITLGDDYRVKKGDVLGVGGASGHVHWEVMEAPMTPSPDSGSRYLASAVRVDPIVWFDRVTATVDHPASAAAAAATARTGSGGGGGLLLLVGAYFVGRELRWW